MTREELIKECDEMSQLADDTDFYASISRELKRERNLEMAIRDLFASHIELVAEKDKCYFKIKNSKGKEKSFTSKAFEDYWKEVLGR